MRKQNERDLLKVKHVFEWDRITSRQIQYKVSERLLPI